MNPTTKSIKKVLVKHAETLQVFVFTEEVKKGDVVGRFRRGTGKSTV